MGVSGDNCCSDANRDRSSPLLSFYPEVAPIDACKLPSNALKAHRKRPDAEKRAILGEIGCGKRDSESTDVDSNIFVKASFFANGFTPYKQKCPLVSGHFAASSGFACDIW